MDQIEHNLWLGSYPSNQHLPLLRKNSIKSILTIDVLPLKQPLFSEFACKFIYMLDEQNENILDSLDEAIDFINKQLLLGGVYVHCTAGISRSATIIIAFLMQKHRYIYDEAIAVVLKTRNVSPNIGFVTQLRLFAAMDYTVNKESNIYRQLMVHFEACKRGGKSLLPSAFVNHFSDTSSYTCRKCRMELFGSLNLMAHRVPPNDRDLQSSNEENNVALVASENCELFTEPLKWTQSCSSEIEGKLYCPGCSAKVGSYNWCGEPCVCGTWVIPAFHFKRGHLDKLS